MRRMAARPTLRSTLQIDAVHHSFGQHVVLTDLNLRAEAGERIAIRGPNGSGKTTLLRCIAGTLTPTSGSIRIAGHEAGSLDARRITGISLSQERSFYMRLSGRENLLLFARLNSLGKTAAARRVDELADELELGGILRERTDRCSSGQLQQLTFARALVGDPKLVLLDEPTRSLDVEARARLWQALARRPHVAVVIATHLDEDVDHVTSVVDLQARSA
jgi:ABC-type multidrug transport system ATPase subunit